MAGTRTLTVTPGFTVEREAMTQTIETDFENTGLFSRFSTGQRPIYKFSIELPVLDQIQAQSLAAFHFFHQGSKAFFYDGGLWGQISSFNLIGEGDGTRTEFFLQNRNIDTNSISIAIDDGAARSVTTAFSLNDIPGVIAFDTSPQSGDDILSATGHKYRVLFAPEGLKIVQFTKGVWRAQLNLRETVL